MIKPKIFCYQCNNFISDIYADVCKTKVVEINYVDGSHTYERCDILNSKGDCAKFSAKVSWVTKLINIFRKGV